MIKKFLIFSGLILFVGVFAQSTTHTVAKGDNPYNIAKKYGMTLEELFKLNPKAKEGKLNIGDKLTVKGKTKTVVAASSVSNTGNSSQLGYIIVKPKQTLYGITKQYHISEAELRKLNPGLEMKIGERVSLPQNLVAKYADADAKNESYAAVPVPMEAPSQQTPVKANPTYVTTGTSSDDYVTYTVQQGDTTFGIVNKFGVSLDELIRLNSELSNGLKPGMVLKIRKAEQAYVKKSGDELNVVIMLPLGYDSSDNRYRSMSLEFLSGAKLAIERNAKLGQKLKIKVVDAGNEASFKNSLVQINRDNTDLIIGPFFKYNVLEVLDYVKDSKIPVVAPFANSQDLYGFSNLIIMETNQQVFADRIIQEVKNVFSDQKIYIVADQSKANANYIKEGLEKNLKNANVIIVNSASEIVSDTNMMTGQSAPVIAILANDSSAEGDAFANRLIAMSQQVQGTKAFSMYYSPVFDKKADDLLAANLIYLTDRKINTEGDFEKEILGDFKDKYCKTPSKYAVVGFDVLNDMLTRENNRGEIFKQINKTQTQLATKFEFVRVQKNGAYVNTGYRVIRLVQ